MRVEGVLAEIKRKYAYKSKARLASLERAELAFIAMLDHFFKGAAGTDALFSKRKLEILDVGCSTMPYAHPLKAFFERFRHRREARILGIDTEIGAIFASMDIDKSGIEGIRIEHKRIQQLGKGGYDLVTCFNFHTRDAAGFFRKISELLNKDGMLLLSFDLKEEFKSQEQDIQDAGFEMIRKEGNPFSSLLSPFIFKHRLLCLARKKG